MSQEANAAPESVPESGLFCSIRPLRRGAIVRDALAGLQLAALNIPQVLGYAQIAGMPFVTGLYTLLLPVVGFAAFASSRFLVVAADSATAAILAGGISPIAAGDNGRYIALASLVALMTAVFLLLARLLGIGFIADFLSRTVLVGFLTGIGFQVGITVLPGMLGLDVNLRRTPLVLAAVVRHSGEIHSLTLYISMGVLAVIFLLHRVAPKFPGPILAVVGGIAAGAYFHLAGRGVSIVGPVVGGLPRLGIPQFAWKDLETLVPVSVSCLVVIVAQSAATARAYAMRHQQRLNENADLLGLSAANLFAGLSGTFVVNGSPTQTAMMESAGGRSQIAQLVTGAAVTGVLLLLARAFQFLPRCVLAAVVFVIAVRLIDLKGLREIRRESPGEFWLAVLTAVVVVAVGVEQGIVLAMVLSLLRIVHHSYHPHTGVLVETERGDWRTELAAPGALTEPGLAVYRFGAPLFYANANRFSDEILRLADQNKSELRWVIVDAEAMTNVDYSAARVVRALNESLARRGVALVFSRVHPELQADLDRHDITEAIGREHIFSRLHEAISAYRLLPAVPTVKYR
ncbi:MAG: SulP family inorganic anion transporter [Candidatus Acidiferrales bacterium]